MKHILALTAAGCMTAAMAACSATGKRQTQEVAPEHTASIAQLQDSLTAITQRYEGEIGVAMITDCGDTITVGNTDKYPLMSVFKLHQAMALCHRLEQQGASLDSIVTLRRDELNPDTWSPMMKDHTEGDITLSLGQLLRYTLMQSDNNASNYMFDHLQGVAAVDSFIATLIPRESFRLNVTESDMWDNHSLCYDNHSSPLGVGLLLQRLYTDSILADGYRQFICTAMAECSTGADRIAAPLTGIDGVAVGHKTGSGFRNANGILTAHNDAAFITLPAGRHYTLVVLVKDFNGPESEASEAISRISAAVYSIVAGQLYR